MANDTPSDTVLDETPQRALKLLGAAGRNVSIFGQLARRGYDAAAHEEGWQLLLAASGYRAPHSTNARPLPSPKGVAALQEIDAWDEPNFRVAHAALDRAFPDQSAFLFEDLSAATGAGAVLSVTTFLDRRDVLAKGRKESAKEDRAAVKKLAERGITDDVAAHLRKLLAEAVVGPDAPPVAPPPPSSAGEARKAKLALHAWYAEWSGIARVEVTRRDYLVQLGLAVRSVKKKSVDQPLSPPGIPADDSD